MKNFELYAQYYDLLYKEKDYQSEVEYVDKLIKNNSAKKVESILDLGCGTGKHDYFLSQLDYRIEGVDLSKDMIGLADKKYHDIPELNFHQGNINSWMHPECKSFDAVVSLFHVLSYQTSNKNVLDTFRTAYTHLEPGGLFIFDCWYGSGVLNDKPTVRVKRLEDDKIKVQRISEPDLHYNENMVDVHFDVQITDKATEQQNYINELHRMRYFFIPELTLFAQQGGFQCIDFFEWMTMEQPKHDSWNIVGILKKV